MSTFSFISPPFFYSQVRFLTKRWRGAHCFVIYITAFYNYFLSLSVYFLSLFPSLFLVLSLSVAPPISQFVSLHSILFSLSVSISVTALFSPPPRISIISSGRLIETLTFLIIIFCSCHESHDHAVIDGVSAGRHSGWMWFWFMTQCLWWYSISLHQDIFWAFHHPSL